MIKVYELTNDDPVLLYRAFLGTAWERSPFHAAAQKSTK